MKTLKNTPIMLLAAWMLTACASTTITPTPPRLPPPALTAQCPDLPPAANGKLATILQNSIERAQLYYDCQARHKALAEWAEQPPAEAGNP